MANQVKSKNDPMKYKTGKVRLGPLNLDQLNKLLAATVRTKVKAKIANRIRIVTSRSTAVA